MAGCCKKKETPTHQTSANVQDGILMLSIPEAQSPVVWQMDIAQVRAAALELREGKAGKEEVHILTFKTIAGETSDIATFTNKAEALASLTTISQALQGKKGGGSCCGGKHHHGAPQKSKRKWLWPLLLCIVVIALFYYLATLLPSTPMDGNAPMTTQSSPSSSNNNAETGVPMSADDFLKGM